MSTGNVKTYFVVQPFSQGPRGRLKPDAAMSARDQEHALRLAGRLAERKAGVVAFSRTGDPDIGEFEDAQIIVRHGQLPSDFEELAAA